jgi:hypothetical protein
MSLALQLSAALEEPRLSLASEEREVAPEIPAALAVG